MMPITTPLLFLLAAVPALAQTSVPVNIAYYDNGNCTGTAALIAPVPNALVNGASGNNCVNGPIYASFELVCDEPVCFCFFFSSPGCADNEIEVEPATCQANDPGLYGAEYQSYACFYHTS